MAVVRRAWRGAPLFVTAACAARVRGSAAAAALGLLAACAGTPPADADLARALVGVWCSPAEGGAGCWAHDSFSADGGFRACGRQPDEARGFDGRGRYTVTGRRLCYTIEQASSNFWLPAGARYCSDILAIDAGRQVWRDIDTGTVHTLLRLPALPPGAC